MSPSHTRLCTHTHTKPQNLGTERQFHQLNANYPEPSFISKEVIVGPGSVRDKEAMLVSSEWVGLSTRERGRERHTFCVFQRLS